jgi:hypothetical protein
LGDTTGWPSLGLGGPPMEGLRRALEALHLLQRRTISHSHLVDGRNFPRFATEERPVTVGASRWAVLRPEPG